MLISASPIMSASHASPNMVAWSDEELSLTGNFDDALFSQFEDNSWTTDSQSPLSTTQMGTVSLPPWHSPSAFGKAQANALSVAASPQSPIRQSQDNQPLDESPEADSSGSSDEGRDSTIDRTLQGTKTKEATGKTKVQRRQGVTCDQCRSKHIRCIMQQSTSTTSPEAASTPGSASTKNGSANVHCIRCIEKGLECTRNHAPPSRRYPRPSRTGKRIEQARMLHGTIAGSNSSEGAGSAMTSSTHSGAASPTAAAIIAASYSIPHVSNLQLHQHVIAGSVSLRLLTCFFATAHMQLPIVDFHNFSARYNFAQGDFRIMSIMANGGDDTQRIPSARQSAPGLWANQWPPTVAGGSSTRSTAGTTEALVAAMHAWAALYTDVPLAFGSSAGLLPLVRDDDETSADARATSTKAHANADGSKRESSEEQAALVMGANGKLRRPKRKQGVACDTCRLRRLRCDKLERPDGMGCSRCEDKRIICTDEYIQSKRSKGKDAAAAAASSDAPAAAMAADESAAAAAATEHDGEDDVISSARYAHAQDLKSARGTGPASWRGPSSQQTAWIDAGPRLPQNYQFGRGREMLAYGKARQAFTHTLLERAMSLIGRHELLQTPSLESIQTLMILVQVLNLLKRTEAANELAEAVNSHLSLLGLESTDEVDEQDKSAVEQILSNMQRKRLWCCVWTRDALITGLFRRVPAFKAERAFGIKGSTGSRNDRRVVIANANANTASKGNNDDANGHEASSTSQAESSARRSQEINGEMGLSFSIMALMQVGALSRFMGKHIDNVDQHRPAVYLGPGSGQSREPSATRFPMMPTPAELRKVERATHALWRSIDSLLLFFDECALKARRNMDSLHPFQPLGWIATIKMAGAMLDLVTLRILTERTQLARTCVEATSAMTGVLSAEMQALAHQQVAQLAGLQAAAHKRSLSSCRRIATMTEFLLSRNVFQASGILLRNIGNVATFLAHTPAVASPAALTSPSYVGEDTTTAASIVTATPADLSPTAGAQSIDPRTLLGGSATADITPPSTTATTASEQGHVPDDVFTGNLPPFDALRKYHEVQVCMEAMAQTGYALPSVEEDIHNVERVLHYSMMAAAAPPPLSSSSSSSSS